MLRQPDVKPSARRVVVRPDRRKTYRLTSIGSGHSYVVVGAIAVGLAAGSRHEMTLRGNVDSTIGDGMTMKAII
jgi:hypothetical protein